MRDVIRESLPEIIGGLVVALVLAVLSLLYTNLGAVGIGLILLASIVFMAVFIKWQKKIARQNAIAERLNRLISIAEEILDVANSSLVENENVLIPLFQDNSTKDKVYAEMVGLYHRQRNRGDFGRWESFLTETLETETELDIRSIISALLEDVNRLYDAFYRESPYSSVKPSKNMTLDKLSLATALKGEGYILRDREVVQIARWYLDSLRETVEHIGRLVGELKAKVQ